MTSRLLLINKRNAWRETYAHCFNKTILCQDNNGAEDVVEEVHNRLQEVKVYPTEVITERKLGSS
jgi:hypothetical protein